MKLIGLTGGIGMGKSTSADFLASYSLAVADTDQIARQVVEPGQPALNEIRDVFGPGILKEDGQLNREALAGVVFESETRRKELERILHPRIRSIWLKRAAAWREEDQSVGVVVIPLLFETDAREALDAVVCVACTGATQQKRLLQRGWTARQTAQRIGAQWPISQKLELSDYVIWTEGSLEVHHEQWRRILHRIQTWS